MTANESAMLYERCALEDCDAAASYHARIEWRDSRGSGSDSLTKPFGFCEDHGRALRGAPPAGAVWLEYFQESE